MPSVIRKATLGDVHQIYDLYKAVTKHNPGNLTQEDYEVTIDYVEEMVKTSFERGLVLVIDRDGEIIGFFKAFTSKFKCLAHVLGDGTAMILPTITSGYGAKLIIKALDIISKTMCHIMQFDIVPHEKNKLAIQLYKKLGFQYQFNNQNKIRNYDGSFGGEFLMSWRNNNFSLTELAKYHDYLKEKYFTNKDKMVDIYKNKKTYSSDNIINLSTTNNILADDIKKNLNRSFNF
jgi:hypothetical protein